MALPDDEISAEFQPQPGDDEHITRGEHRRMSALLVRRLQRIEGLCFDDERDEQGKITRPSLKTLIEMGTKHIQVMCSWAHLLKRIIAGIASVGALITIGYQVWGIFF